MTESGVSTHLLNLCGGIQVARTIVFHACATNYITLSLVEDR